MPPLAAAIAATPSAGLAPTAACAAACLAAAVAAWGVFLVRGSTAVPAAVWSVAACLALAAELSSKAAGGLTDPATAAAGRLAVGALSLCPTLSLLGAKRPQHGVWQLIVATLAVVLVMPAVSARLMRPGSLPDVHLLERCFMPLLVLVGWMNFAGTRRAVAVTCVAAGQLLLLRGFLPGFDMAAAFATTTAPTASMGIADAVAAGLVLIGSLLAAVQAVRAEVGQGRRHTRVFSPDHGVASIINPPFLALRETLGAAWTLRIAERFSTVAAARGWPCRLTFGGLETADSSPETAADHNPETAADRSPETAWQRDALRAFRALARRFVSDDWLDRHGWPAAGLNAEGSV
jgi:hypothetical protein